MTFIVGTEIFDGTLMDAADINTNIDAIKNVVNGQLDNANLKAAAAIAISKLAGYPANAAVVLRGDGSWGIAPVTALPPSAISGFPNDATKVLKGDGSWALVGDSSIIGVSPSKLTGYPANVNVVLKGDGSWGGVSNAMLTGPIDPAKLAGFPGNVALALLGDGSWKQIENAQIAPAAAIAISKLAGFPADAAVVLKGDGSWGAVPPPAFPPLADSDIPASIARDAEVTAALAAYQPLAAKGAANGYAPLDGSSKVPAANLPAAVGLPADTVVVAGTRIVANKLLAGDANESFRFMGDGKHQWGPGGATALDTTLYRSAAGVLKTDGSLDVAGASITIGSGIAAGGLIQLNWQPTLSGYRLQMGDAVFTGQVWHSGMSSFNATYGGSTANEVYVGTIGAAAAPGIWFARDVTLYRSAAGVLKTNAQLEVGAAGLKFADATVMTTAAVGGGGSLPADTVVAAGTRIIANKLLAGDTQQVWRVLGDGSQAWGAGGAAATDVTLGRAAAGLLYANPSLGIHKDLYVDSSGTGGKAYFGSAADVALYRSASATLSTDGTFQINRASASAALQVKLLAADAQPTFRVSGSGKHEWGPGGAAGLESNLYNIPGGGLKMDSILTVGAGLKAPYLTTQGGTANEINIWSDGKIYFGSSLDTNLYRSAAGVLKSDGHFVVGGQVGSMETGAGQIRLATDTMAASGLPRIYFGPANDTFITRTAAGVLSMSGQVEVGAAGVKFSNGSVQTVAAAGGGLAYLGDWAAGTYQDGDTVVKDGILYQCVGGPTAVAPDPAPWGAAGMAPATFLRKATPKVVVNTTAATDLLNGEITLPALTPAQFVRLTAQGDWINNSGGTNTSFPRMQLLLGGTTLIDTGGIGSVAGYGGSPRYFWRVEAEIAMLGAGVQYVRFFYVCHMNQLTGIAARFTTGSGTVNCLTNTSTLGFLQADGYNNGAVDMATPRLLALNTILGFAHASIDITLKHAIVEIF